MTNSTEKKMSNKEIIADLQQKLADEKSRVGRRDEKVNELNVVIEEQKVFIEEQKAVIIGQKDTISDLQSTQKKVREPKPTPTFTGTATSEEFDFKWIGKYITAEEYREWVKNPEEEKTFEIKIPRTTDKKRSEDREQKVIDNQCFARIWNGGAGGQCNSQQKEGCDYCSQHQKQYDDNKLKHGDTRTQDIPLFPKWQSKLFPTTTE